MRFTYKTLCLSFLVVLPAIASAGDTDIFLTDVVVTAPRMEEPLTIVTDPKAPRSPVPAHDGADYLKTIPGFSVMRKGGTDGEPVLRGMAGSRINILVDGQNVLGGCSMRMDAPTSYIFPEAFDQLTVMKGPQTVLNGPGASAGTVLFERYLHQTKAAGVTGNASALVGSYGRHDEVADAKFGNETFYARVTGTNSAADDYQDGLGNKVHSNYHRYSGNVAVGFTPDANTGAELALAYSDGEAAYADRGMDGIEFRRANIALRIEKRDISDLIKRINFQVSYNDIDHLMDDYTMRSFDRTNYMGWSRLQHQSTDGKLSGTFKLTESTEATLGSNFQINIHSKGAGGGAGGMAMTAAGIADDSAFRNVGVFGEVKQQLTEKARFITGYRADNWQAEDKRSSGASDTSGRSRDETLNSGFVRIEADLPSLPVTTYIGLGHAERFPDYWELVSSTRYGGTKASGADKLSAFLTTKSEKTNQVDVGFISNFGDVSLSASMFYNQINDFILIDRNSPYAVTNMGMTLNGSTRNINAHTYGSEADLVYRIAENWKINSSIAYVRGENVTDHKALAQLPPLEVKLGLNYDNKTWFAGALVRGVTEQNHFSANQGNIAGWDISRSGGFVVTSLNAGWRPTKESLITAGVDNLFDKNYAEFISRGGSNGMGGAITGYTQTTRVNEMGRTFWLKGNITF